MLWLLLRTSHRAKAFRVRQFMQFSENLFKSSSICTLNIIIVCINLMLETFNCILKFCSKERGRKKTHTHTNSHGREVRWRVAIIYNEWFSLVFTILHPIILDHMLNIQLIQFENEPKKNIDRLFGFDYLHVLRPKRFNSIKHRVGNFYGILHEISFRLELWFEVSIFLLYSSTFAFAYTRLSFVLIHKHIQSARSVANNSILENNGVYTLKHRTALNRLVWKASLQHSSFQLNSLIKVFRRTFTYV